MLLLFILVPILFTVPIAFAWKLFSMAGQPSYYAIIPLYNIYIFLKIIDKSKKWWWYLLILCPYFNIFMLLLMNIEMGKCFGKYKIWQELLVAVLPFVYFPMIAAEKNAHYTHPNVAIAPKKSAAREWFDAIVFAVVAAMFIRTYGFELYTIPSSSMEKSLLVGDFLAVSKISYGPLRPNTPLAFPFVHHTLPFSKTTKSYVEWIERSYKRYPGISKIRRNDAVVFNYPAGDTLSDKFQSNVSYYQLVREFGRERVMSDKATFGNIIARPVDKRENYIKRLIGMPGDIVEVVDGIVYINGEKGYQPTEMQYNYRVSTTGQAINSRVLNKYNITEGYRTALPNVFIFNISQSVADELAKLPIVSSVTRVIAPKGKEVSTDLFPNDTLHFKWNVDNYGPIVIPEKGKTVQLTLENLPLYDRVIHAYEGHDLQVKDGKIFIDQVETDTYTFGMNYYWMMGDNRHNSADSRFWGYVPEDHVKGKAVFVLLSLDKQKSLFSGRIRFPKSFRTVK